MKIRQREVLNENKGVGIQAVFQLFLIMVLMTDVLRPRKCRKPAGREKTVEIDTSGDSVKVGILHSLSGTMAISEVSVHDAELMAINEINQKAEFSAKARARRRRRRLRLAYICGKMRKPLQQDKAVAVLAGGRQQAAKPCFRLWSKIMGFILSGTVRRNGVIT